MPYTNLPNTFLQLPEIGNLSIRPTDPYDLGTIGMIHSSKFREICRLVLEHETNISEELSRTLEGHRLKGVLENLELDELADFIRHVALINKQKVRWEFIDDMNYRLSKNYTPRWELPNLGFEHGFRDVFLTRVSWEPAPKIRNLILEFLDDYKENVGETLKFKWQDSISVVNVWNYRDLFLLLNEISYLTSEYKGNLELHKYDALVAQLKVVFEENYKSRIFTVPQRISLIFLYVKAIIRGSNIDFNQIQILLDSSFTLIKQLDTELEKSYRLIFGYTYAIFSFHLFKSTSDLVIQRDLVAELLQDIYKPEEVDLDYWSRHLTTSKPHPLLFSMILRGYFRLTTMLVDYAGSLPKSDSQLELFGIYDDLLIFLKSTLFRYLKIYYKIDCYDMDPDTFVDTINETITYVNFKRIIFQVVRYVDKAILLGKSEITSEEIDDYYKLLSRVYNEKIALIHTVDLRIRKKMYPFKALTDQIFKEFEEKDSIILATTFEDEVIQIIGNIFGEVQNRFKVRDVIDLEEYMVLLLFVSSWLQHLYQLPDLRYESLMILSPLVSICYIQLARGYYEINNLEAAYLSYFNSHYIIEMINDELVESKKKEENRLVEKFSSLINEWNIDYIIDSDYIKRISSNIDLKIRDRMKQRTNKSFSMGGMLKDEIVIGYLDLITKLESFLQVIANGTIPVKEAVRTTEIYEPPNENPKFKNNFLGYLSTGDTDNLFPIPIVRDIETYSMAIKLYPIDVKLPGALTDIQAIFKKKN